MRLYAVALVTWTAIVTASFESNVENFSDEKANSYTEFDDSPVKQIAQPYVAHSIEERSSEGIGDRSDNAAADGPVELSRPAKSASGLNGVSTIDPASLGESATPLTEDGYPFLENPDSDFGYAIPEDVLLVESAGIFGQKVRPLDKWTIAGRASLKISDSRASGEYVSFRKSISSTMSPFREEEDNQRRAHVLSTTRKPSMLTLRKKNNLSDNSPSDNLRETIGPNLSAKNFNGNPKSSMAATNSTSILENNVVLEHLPKPQARGHNGTENKVSVVSTEKLESAATSVEINPSLQLTKFTGPIVVADLPAQKAQDAIISYVDQSSSSEEKFRPLEDADLVSETNIRSSKKTASDDMITTTSSLNPLQVGITLVNAIETTDLVNDSKLSAATETKDYSDVRYKDGDIQSDEGERVIVTQRAPDNSVEIQKSIELYHTAPVHEIHYPVEYIQQTTHLGVIETNSIGNAQRSKQPYDQDERSESRLNYNAYRGNDAAEKSVVKGQAASALSQQLNRQEYNVLEDGVDKPTASTLIAEYSSSTREQTPVDSLKSQRNNEAVSVANHFDDVLYERSNVRHTLNNNDASLHIRFTESPTRHKATDVFAKPYATTSVSYREQQSQSTGQPTDQQHSFRLEAKRPQEQPTQLLLKIIPNGSPTDEGFLVPIPRPYPIEKIVEKTVHVPHPIEVEKVIEKKVPYPVPVDRLVEKQIRVPHLIPIHIERVVEKRVPYTVQRLVMQPPQPYHPLHLRLPVAYSAQAGTPSSFVEQAIEKAAEKPVTSRPDGSIETRYKHQQRLREPISANENVDLEDSGDVAFESQSNASQFYGDPYTRSPLTYDHGLFDNGKYHIPPAAHLPGNVRLMIVPKKFGAHHAVLLRPHVSTPSYTMLPGSFRRQIVYNLAEKDKMDKSEYVGPLPPRKTFVSQTKPLLPAVKPSLYSTSVTQSPATTTGGLRRTRQPEAQYSGSFRQSKMEYGFKPPMVPSVQYDEKTASKVEN